MIVCFVTESVVPTTPLTTPPWKQPWDESEEYFPGRPNVIQTASESDANGHSDSSSHKNTRTYNQNNVRVGARQRNANVKILGNVMFICVNVFVTTVIVKYFGVYN